MRSIVYAGNDFSEICSAEVIERAANPIVAEAMAVPGRAGALLVSGYIPPVAEVWGGEPMEEIDESLGQYVVYYPAAMQEDEGVVEAQFMVSWDDKSISTRAFTIRVEPVIIGGTESENGFKMETAHELTVELNTIG